MKSHIRRASQALDEGELITFLDEENKVLYQPFQEIFRLIDRNTNNFISKRQFHQDWVSAKAGKRPDELAELTAIFNRCTPFEISSTIEVIEIANFDKKRLFEGDFPTVKVKIQRSDKPGSVDEERQFYEVVQMLFLRKQKARLPFLNPFAKPAGQSDQRLVESSPTGELVKQIADQTEQAYLDLVLEFDLLSPIDSPKRGT